MRGTELLDPGAPRPRSRIHGPRRVLSEMRRLLGKVRRAAEYRAATDLEKRWTVRVGDSLEQLIREGDQVLPGGEDPRDKRRARKRQAKMF